MGWGLSQSDGGSPGSSHLKSRAKKIFTACLKVTIEEGMKMTAESQKSDPNAELKEKFKAALEAKNAKNKEINNNSGKGSKKETVGKAQAGHSTPRFQRKSGG